MTKKLAKKIIKEFEKAHSKYSAENLGHFKRGWKKTMKHADSIDGIWYWKGHCIRDLHEIIDKKI